MCFYFVSDDEVLKATKQDRQKGKRQTDRQTDTDTVTRGSSEYLVNVG